MLGSIQVLLNQETMVTLGKDCHELFFNSLFSLNNNIDNGSNDENDNTDDDENNNICGSNRN